MAITILTLLTSFFICYGSIPAIIRIAKDKNLYDEPNERSSHNHKIPSLGGLGIFLGFVFSVFFWISDAFLFNLKYLMCSTLILVSIGLKDDISPISAKKKLAGQLLAVVILVFFADLRIYNFHGVFGIYEIPDAFSYIFSTALIITIVNGFNLIDGINGLAGGIGLISTLIFGVWFQVEGYPQFALIAFAGLGGALGFLPYNIFSARIFLGDTGSLLLGLICSFLCIQFINVHTPVEGQIPSFQGVPAIAVSVLILPIFDTIRVFINRIRLGKSPLEADRNHIHHILIDGGLTHPAATFILLMINLLFIIMAVSLRHLNSLFVLSLMLGVALLLTGLAIAIRNNYSYKRKVSSKEEKFIEQRRLQNQV